MYMLRQFFSSVECRSCDTVEHAVKRELAREPRVTILKLRDEAQEFIHLANAIAADKVGSPWPHA